MFYHVLSGFALSTRPPLITTRGLRLSLNQPRPATAHTLPHLPATGVLACSHLAVGSPTHDFSGPASRHDKTRSVVFYHFSMIHSRFSHLQPYNQESRCACKTSGRERKKSCKHKAPGPRPGVEGAPPEGSAPRSRCRSTFLVGGLGAAGGRPKHNRPPRAQTAHHTKAGVKPLLVPTARPRPLRSWQNRLLTRLSVTK